MNEYLKIEKTFTTPEGYYGVVVFTHMGHRCGYVGVLEDHPLYGEDYTHHDLCNIDVHGGLTFANNYEELAEGYWFFGFDCMHGTDAPDAESAKKYGFPQPVNLWAGTIHTLEYVEAEILKLSAQLTPQAIMQSKMEGIRWRGTDDD